MPVRPFTLADIDGVNALHADIHWPVPSAAMWQWMASNPAHPPDVPLGWVIDNDGRIDGYLGNYRRNAYRGRNRHPIASGHSVIVSPRAKGSLRALLQPFLTQPDTAFKTVLNANAIGSQLYSKLGLAPLPHPIRDQKPTWVLAPSLAALARGLRVAVDRWPILADRLGECFPLRAANLFDPRRVKWPRNVHVIEDLSDNSAYGEFWETLRSENRFVTDRSPATLRWYLSIPDTYIAPLVLGYHDETGLAAYAIGQVSKTRPIDVPVLEILDMVWLSRAPANAVPTLVSAMQKAGYKLGVVKVRLPVVSAALLDALGPKRREARNEGRWCHAFISEDPAAFADWSPTAFDGSDGFTLRQPPRKSNRRPKRRASGQPALET